MYPNRLKQGLKKVSKPVKKEDLKTQVLGENDPTKGKHIQNRGTRPLPKAKEVIPLEKSESLDKGSLSATSDYTTIEVESSQGKRYKLVVPKSYATCVPKVWSWNAERYRVAELIALGVPISHIPEDPQVMIKSRMVIYGWLQHPEFKEHVDGITMETGFANKRERIAGLNRLTQKLFDKVIRELEGIPLTDKSIGPVLSAIQTTAKLIAQEKQEFIEESKVTQDTNITGAITTVQADIENVMESKSEEERKALARAFDEMGDDIIRAITGGK